MVVVCGVDEAGRGPIIGPLVICGVACEESELHKIEELGVKDSKLLSPKRRVSFVPLITERAKHKLIVIEPKEIDEAVMSKELNLNWLEAIKTAEIINALKADKAYVDCPSNNIKAYTQYLRNCIGRDVELIVEHKADSTYPIVSAASICAKVKRDYEIEELKARYNVEFGSGYPADPLTAKFVKQNYSKYDFFRKSWATFKEASQKPLGDYD